MRWGVQGMKLKTNLYFAAIVFILLFVQVHAYGGSTQGVATPAKPPNEIIYYPLPIDYNITQPAKEAAHNPNETAQNATIIATIGNATIIPRDGDKVNPQPTPQPQYPQKAESTVSTASISEERQIDPNYQPEYGPQKIYDGTVVAEASQASIEIDGQQEPIKNYAPSDRCDELMHTNTINFTEEQVKNYKKEMEEVCAPVADATHDGAIKENAIAIHETARDDKDVLRKLIAFREILNSASPEQRKAQLKVDGLTIEYLDKEIERLRNITSARNTTQEIIAQEQKKEAGDGIKKEGGSGIVSVVTNLVVNLIDNIFSIFR